jgi:fibronectin-binding autotransporter adhesin
MKPKSTLRSFLLLAGSSLLAISSASAQTTYTWDTTTAAGVLGGTGAWNTSNSLWTTDGGATNTSWVNAGAAPFNNAIFGGATGTVTLGEAISLRNLSFTNTAGAYTITGSTLNFTGGTITGPNSTAAESAIIRSNITGAPAINLQPMAGDRQFTLNPVASGSMVIGAVTGDGGNGSEILNLQGGTGSTGTIASVTGPKVIVTGGSWTINGASSGRNHAVSAGTLTLNANLNGTLRAVILSGTGTLNYNVASAVSATAATNTSTDNGFRITGGTLDNTSGAAINTNASTTHIDLAGNLTFAGTNGANSNLHLGSGPVWLKDGNRQISVTNAASTLTIGGVIQNDDTLGRSLTKAGAGTLRLSGTGSTYTGVTTITAGTLSVAAIGNGGVAGSLGQATNAAGNIVFNGGTLLYTGANATSDRAFTINAGITATIETTNNLSLAGATGTATTGALTKTGAGALTLTGASTYTGATNVTAGTLALASTGSIDNSSGVSLGGGTFDVSAKSGYSVSNLTGNGNVVGAITVSTALGIGASPGTISFGSDLTLGAASAFNYEFTGGASTADLGIVAGDLTIISGATLNLTQIGSFTLSDTFTLFAYDNVLTGTFAGLAEGATATDNLGGLWRINYGESTAGLNFGGDPTGLSFVNITAIPEPSAALLGGLGLLLLLRRRR